MLRFRIPEILQQIDDLNVGGWMVNFGKKNVLGIMIDAVDYDVAVSFVFERVRQIRSAMVSALAVHGVMTGVLDPEHKFRLNSFDLLVPDGQPVRWVLNWLYGTGLSDRVYGPALMLRICERAAAEGAPIYLYGSTQSVVTSLVDSLSRKFPGIKIAGSEPSVFRDLNPDENASLEQRIRLSGASIVFIGLGCPLQEVFTCELAGSSPFQYSRSALLSRFWPDSCLRPRRGCSASAWNGSSASSSSRVDYGVAIFCSIPHISCWSPYSVSVCGISLLRAARQSTIYRQMFWPTPSLAHTRLSRPPRQQGCP